MMFNVQACVQTTSLANTFHLETQVSLQIPTLTESSVAVAVTCRTMDPLHRTSTPPQHNKHDHHIIKDNK